MFSYQSHLIVYLVLVAAFVVLHLPRVQSDESQTSKWVRSYCGRDLANTMARVCSVDLNMVAKRSGEEMAMNDNPLRSRSRANAITRRFGAATFHRQIRGIVDECCMNPCSIDNLQSYC